MDFGERLRAARKAKNLSGDALGKMLDPPVSKQSISHWEKGEHPPDVNQVRQLCAALGMSADDLVLGVPASFDQLNGFEGQLVALFRQLSPGAKGAILQNIRSVIGVREITIGRTGEGEAPMRPTGTPADTGVVRIPEKKVRVPREISSPYRTNPPAPARKSVKGGK